MVVMAALTVCVCMHFQPHLLLARICVSLRECMRSKNECNSFKIHFNGIIFNQPLNLKQQTHTARRRPQQRRQRRSTRWIQSYWLSNAAPVNASVHTNTHTHTGLLACVWVCVCVCVRVCGTRCTCVIGCDCGVSLGLVVFLDRWIDWFEVVTSVHFYSVVRPTHIVRDGRFFVVVSLFHFRIFNKEYKKNKKKLYGKIFLSFWLVFDWKIPNKKY